MNAATSASVRTAYRSPTCSRRCARTGCSAPSRPWQQPLVEELVAQLDRQARQRRGSVRVLLTPDRLYLSVEVVLRRCAFETPASRYLFDALAQNAVRVSIDAAADGICLFAAIRNRDAEAEARAESYEPDELFLQMLQSFGEE